MTARHGGFLTTAEAFDPYFFGISPREAQDMDPQQRMFLEVAWEAIEAAGLTLSRLQGTDAGVFVAAKACDFLQMQLRRRDRIGTYTSIGAANSPIPNRLSYSAGPARPEHDHRLGVLGVPGRRPPRRTEPAGRRVLGRRRRRHEPDAVARDCSVGKRYSSALSRKASATLAGGGRSCSIIRNPSLCKGARPRCVSAHAVPGCGC